MFINIQWQVTHVFQTPNELLRRLNFSSSTFLSAPYKFRSLLNLLHSVLNAILLLLECGKAWFGNYDMNLFMRNTLVLVQNSYPFVFSLLIDCTLSAYLYMTFSMLHALVTHKLYQSFENYILQSVLLFHNLDWFFEPIRPHYILHHIYSPIRAL